MKAWRTFQWMRRRISSQSAEFRKLCIDFLKGSVVRSLLLTYLMAACAVLASAKPDTWHEVQTPHFVVLCNSGEKQARHVADQFERMRAVFHRNFPKAHVDPASPIVVIAVKDKKDFAALEPEAYLAKGQLDLAGLFLQTQDRNYVLLRLDAAGEHPFSTVYHEYTHFILSHVQEWLPLWLNEGLAEFYQNTEIRDKEVALGEASAVNLMLLQQNRLLPLPTLLAVDYNSPYYHEEDKGSIFYAESWALTHYLEIKDRQDNTERLLEYGKLVSQNVDPVSAATQAFGDLKQLQKNLERYVAQGSFFYFKLSGATEVDESSFKVRAITTGQADAVRADFLACNHREKDARAMLDRVLREEPDNVQAHEAMGSLAFWAGRYDEAEKWYAEAVKLDSQSYLAHFYYAITAIREGFSHENADRIEASLRAATKLNPSFAPAFDQLAAFYGQQRTNLKEASSLSVAAIQMEPGNINFRINLAHILMEMDRTKDAIVVLEAATKLAKNPEQAATIQSQVEQYQQYQALRERHDRQYAEDRQRYESGAQEVIRIDDPEPSIQQTNESLGPRRTVKGTLTNVRCSSVSTLRLKVAGTPEPVNLHSLNYFKVEYSALNFKPNADLNPCKDLEGMKAKVEYFEGVSQPSEGQIISIEITK